MLKEVESSIAEKIYYKSGPRLKIVEKTKDLY